MSLCGEIQLGEVIIKEIKHLKLFLLREVELREVVVSHLQGDELGIVA